MWGNNKQVGHRWGERACFWSANVKKLGEDEEFLIWDVDVYLSFFYHSGLQGYSISQIVCAAG